MSSVKGQMKAVCDRSGPVSVETLSTKLIDIDGIGLACGVFEHLLGIDDPPKVLAATHYHEIFENDFLALRPNLQLGHMEVKVCEESQEVENQVTYLYKFVYLVNVRCNDFLKLLQLSRRTKQQKFRDHVCNPSAQLLSRSKYPDD
jgi:hypothetical protein